MSSLVDGVTLRRAREAFAAHVAPIAGLLADDSVMDIMLNVPRRPGAPGDVWADIVGVGMRHTGVTLTAEEAERIVRDVGRQASGERRLDPKNPVLSCQAALGQFRFEALLPPATPAPTFTIRKYVKRDARLSDYVETRELTGKQAIALSDAAQSGQTILLAGETGSGKTTMLNALLHDAAISGQRRMLIIEDTPELDCPDGPSSRIEVNPASAFGYREAVVSALRQRPNTIALGEVRRPDDAMQAVEAWNTGHQGFGTIHAPSVTGALWRLYSLCRQSESGRHVEPRTILDAIQVVVHMKRVRGRRVIQACRVTGWTGEDFAVCDVAREP